MGKMKRQKITPAMMIERWEKIDAQIGTTRGFDGEYPELRELFSEITFEEIQQFHKKHCSLKRKLSGGIYSYTWKRKDCDEEGHMEWFQKRYGNEIKYFGTKIYRPMERIKIFSNMLAKSQSDKDCKEYHTIIKTTKQYLDKLILETPLLISLEWCLPEYIETRTRRYPGATDNFGDNDGEWYERTNTTAGRNSGPTWKEYLKREPFEKLVEKRKNALETILAINWENKKDKEIIKGYESRMNETISNNNPLALG